MLSETDGATTLPMAVASALARFADEPALVTGDAVTTFAALGGRLVECLAHPAMIGLPVGARVVVALANSPEVRVIEFVTLLGGFVRVPVSARLAPLEVAAIALDCQADLVVVEPAAVLSVRSALSAAGRDVRVVDSSFASRTEGASAALPEPASVSPDDVAVILYSSGTTGRPKGAVHTNRTWLAHVGMSLAALPSVGPGDVVLAAAPLSHFAGTIAMDCALAGAALATTTVTDGPGMAAAVQRSGATILPLVPMLLTRLARHLAGASALRSLRAVPYGGSTIPEDDLRLAARVLPGRLIQFYGLAEVLAPVSVLSAAAHDRAAAGDTDPAEAAAILASCGEAVPGAQVRIRDGRVQLRSSASFTGYLGLPELTARAHTPDGWFDTADIGTLVEGRITVLGRSDDEIATGGFGVQPGEVEEVLRQHPLVLDACVVGIPDPQWGSTVAAAVTVRRPVDDRAFAAELTDWCGEHIAGYKKPRRVIVLDALPSTAVGKLDRRAVRARLETPHDKE